ncbi:MAG: hypothetical protein GY736_08950 [Sphingomonas sp.]|uniref:Cytochrome bd-type quinol oxidase subunit 2 n=1 Tax=Sphingomonas aquatilis TaxID=93063 RepID=A0AAW3TWP1_9SPHN|nr:MULTISPECIES: hypothetical protein [Sphingomonas]MBB3877022.1 cytochrome bd-type quinol oxidase subunit 2 [Sphingomonas aquatilis]MCP4026419.1 hypothetical protein [Sphingomonas sp.]
MNLYITSFWLILVTLSAAALVLRDRPTIRPISVTQPQLPVVAMFWTAAVLTVLLRPSVDQRFMYTEHALLLIDFGLFGGLAWVAVRSGKGWVLCTAALQLVSATAHLARLVTPNMFRLGYQVMEEASSYPTLVLLAWGLIGHARSRRRSERSRDLSS